jgi:hypothetical protein
VYLFGVEEISTGVNSGTPDAVVATATGDSPSTPQGTSAPSEQTSATSQPLVQGEQNQAQGDSDPLTGVPSTEELSALVEQNVPHAKALAQLRGAYEPLKTQFSELESKFKPFESVADRFQTSEEVQELVELKDSLFGYERDDRNQLIPSTQKAAELLSTKYPLHSNYLWADMAEGQTQDPDTGQPITRIDLALKHIASDPNRRAQALQLLGGVEPTSIAPTWQPSTEELAVIDDPEYPTAEGKALAEIYKSLPYDERQELRANNPEFIKSYLKKEQFQRNLMEQNRVATERETRQQQQREAYFNQQAEQAGNSYVESQFKTGFAEFANNIVERSQFIKPLDAQSAPQGTSPEQIASMNQDIQKINVGVGKMIATVTAALSVPDTAWVAADLLTNLGVDPKVIQEFDNARLEFARNARDYGELEYKAKSGQMQGANGLGNLQSNSTNAMKAMRARANLVAKPLQELMSKFFEMKASNYNSTLNGAAVARPPVNGSNYDPTTAPAIGQLPAGKLTRAEIDRQFG